MNFEGETSVVVLIKAAPEMGRKHGETVCVAGIDQYGKWHRLYPVPFRDLASEQRFKRWDRIRVRWKRPSDDSRIESKRIDPQNLKVEGRVPDGERAALVERAVIANLEQEQREGRSLALIRPTNIRFVVRKLSSTELMKSQRRRDALRGQLDLLADSEIAAVAPPYSFFYEFDHAGRRRRHLCIDWETEATFLKWRDRYGEGSTLDLMQQKWGEGLPARGLAFAMGTHRVEFWKNWLLSGIIQAPNPSQGQLAL